MLRAEALFSQKLPKKERPPYFNFLENCYSIIPTGPRTDIKQRYDSATLTSAAAKQSVDAV